ncbi:MAG: S-layer homology domain-containing protein [Clostridiales bacterium]|nr:S-layer homology domain-containing protein [Clostridiales bacterium]
MRPFSFGHPKYLFATMCSVVALIVILALPGFARADSVTIDETNFPDETLREDIKEYDKDNDGVLSEEEISKVDSIVIYDKPVTSTKGIEFFTNVEYIMLNNTGLTSIDVSKNTKLVTLYCEYNKLKKLDVTNNPNLGNLNCDQNSLTSLDLSKNPNLASLICNDNKLTELDLSNNPELVDLDCSNNRLTELDLSHSKKISTLYCSNNKLEALDVQWNTEINLFNCSYNKISSLNLKNCTKITTVFANDNNLKSISAKNLPKLRDLVLSNNKLSSVDLEGDTILDSLHLDHNQLTSFDLSKTKKLDFVDLSYNKLKKLVTSKNGGIDMLNVDNNQLTSIDVSKNHDLYTLSIAGNQLTKIDISNLPRIDYLDCSDNKIKTIDISKNKSMDSLFCANNPIQKLDLSKNNDLHRLSCFGTDIAKLDISKNPNLKRAMEKGEFSVGTNNKGEPFYTYFDFEEHDSEDDDWTEYFHLSFDASTEVVNGSKTKITLDKSIANLVCGKSLKLKATLTGSKTNIVWKSSDEKIATVDSSGNVKAKMAGPVTITASANGFRVGCEITVLYKDVTNSKDFWYKPTNMLTRWGVVKGYDKQTKFKPANDCTRAQMLTFIWRLVGSPEPESQKCSFSDVKKTDYFFKPVIWAVEKGITTGYNDGTFKPQNVCTRAQTVTFLWRLAGEPDPNSKKCPFKDVKKSNYFYLPVIWAYENKIVAGYKDGTFKPQGKCLRRQMVTFLYKDANTPNYNNVR